jgi:hypothetical protein
MMRGASLNEHRLRSHRSTPCDIGKSRDQDGAW